MAYYRTPPTLTTRVVQTTRTLGPEYRTGRYVLTTPTWLGAQQGTTPTVRPQLWNRIPVSLAEGREPVPWWDVLLNRGL